MTAKNLPVSEQPYEKCLKSGAASLSDAELLAVIIRCGTNGSSSTEVAKHVLSKRTGNLLGLYQMSLKELQEVPGIGKVKAIQLKCIVELSKRIAQTGRQQAVVMQNAFSVADYYMEQLRHEEKEHLMLCMFDTKCHLIADSILSIGTVNASLISPREIFLKAFEYHAVHVILVHNHPSGNPLPSRQDIEVTRKIVEGGRLLGIELADHIIIGDKKYFSFKEQEML